MATSVWFNKDLNVGYFSLDKNKKIPLLGRRIWYDKLARFHWNQLKTVLFEITNIHSSKALEMWYIYQRIITISVNKSAEYATNDAYVY